MTKYAKINDVQSTAPQPAIHGFVRSKNPPKPATGQKIRRAGSTEMPLLSLLVFGGLFYGWFYRAEGHINAETGIGYTLGIVGSAMMLTLLLYPLRKRLAFLRVFGSVRGWFRLHMILGVIGPALVVLHSNFTMGSLNSTVALIAMSIVALSGFVGRFFYARIHRGLYGHKHSARELLDEVTDMKNHLQPKSDHETALRELLGDYEARRLSVDMGVGRSLINVLSGPVSRTRLRSKMMTIVHAKLNLEPGEMVGRQARLERFKTDLDLYFHASAKAEAFTLYERLFAAWHLLHLPLFAILVLAALVHVLAVHLY